MSPEDIVHQALEIIAAGIVDINVDDLAEILVRALEKEHVEILALNLLDIVPGGGIMAKRLPILMLHPLEDWYPKHHNPRICPRGHEFDEDDLNFRLLHTINTTNIITEVGPGHLNYAIQEEHAMPEALDVDAQSGVIQCGSIIDSIGTKCNAMWPTPMELYSHDSWTEPRRTSPGPGNFRPPTVEDAEDYLDRWGSSPHY